MGRHEIAMIYVFYGTDREGAVAKLHSTLQILKGKKPDAERITFSPENWEESAFEASIERQGLFEKKSIVVLDSLLSYAPAKEFVMEHLVEMEESENVFLILEKSILAGPLGKIKKVSEKVEEFKAVEGRRFTPFPLSDAWARGDKKNAWVLYQEALKKMSPEEIHGALFWQVKAMILASNSKSAKESGLSPFVFSKSASFAKGKSQEKLKRTLGELLSLYHDARKGGGELEIALERFILGSA